MMKRTKLTGMIVAGAVAAMGLTLASYAQMGGASDGKSQKDEHAHKHHAKLGEKAPDFTLVSATGEEITLSDYGEGKIVVLEWFNAECPIVKRHYEKYTTMKDTSAKFADQGVVWLAINSGAPGKQGHGKDKAAIEAWKIQYPVLVDEKGKVGHMYGATNTPHMYIIDKTGTLVFAGAIDNDPRDSMAYADKTNYVVQALNEVIAGTPVSEASPKAYGCSVKYGN